MIETAMEETKKRQIFANKTLRMKFPHNWFTGKISSLQSNLSAQKMKPCERSSIPAAESFVCLPSR